MVVLRVCFAAAAAEFLLLFPIYLYLKAQKTVVS